MAGEQLNIRVTPAFRERLDKLAAEQKTAPAALIKQLVMGACPEGGVAGEARQLEDRFGLSPIARRRLGWSIDEAPSAELVSIAGRRSVRAATSSAASATTT